ncbi:hypothetical protein CY34DRAFT_805611 [Suillus luteus UH-Slu-Lm8-n1]|uniref:Uncharacterized protein n=1 Tax=Suillus luteus UH-Slu-Lm8-n1 TaxID=930992 RepID=A0A0D0AVC2_9AGAM|nr:hypothetical protein CY34DRAFT_805611 [Suillus luteus UH-Slu-Lm8-n1]
MSRLRLRVKFDFVGATRSNYIVRVHTSAIRQGSNVFEQPQTHLLQNRRHCDGV